VKYLAELYNFKMVDSSMIFDTLYRILTFGHVKGTPLPGQIAPLDLPDNFFRARLIVTILETCGTCFDRGLARKKLDFFLTFFQYYLNTKEPMPMDIEYMVHDVYALTRPQWKFIHDLEEAGSAFAEAVAANYKAPEVEKFVESQEEVHDDVSSDEVEGDAAANAEGVNSSEEAEKEGVNGKAENDSSEEEITVTRHGEEERDPEADADFDRELAKMMAEGLDSRKFERKPMFDVPLPMRRAQKEPTSAGNETPPEEPTEEPKPNVMAFSLMTKKGNRQQVCQISQSPANTNQPRLVSSNSRPTPALPAP
jgi:regulator of nonsense transcripts 2